MPSPDAIDLPADHPTLEMVDGNLYSKKDHRLIAQLSDEPIQDGTIIIGKEALNPSLRIALPESVKKLYICREESGNYTKCFVVPGSPAEAFFISIY